MNITQRKEERNRQDVIASQSELYKKKRSAADMIERRQLAKEMAAGDQAAFEKLWDELGGLE